MKFSRKEKLFCKAGCSLNSLVKGYFMLITNCDWEVGIGSCKLRIVLDVKGGRAGPKKDTDRKVK